MQAETLQAALTDLSKLHDIATSELEDVVESYPYFQTAHLLLLKKYQISGDSKFTDYLSTAATYAPDRKWLHHFVEEVQVPEPEAVLEGTAETPTVEDPVISEAAEQEPVAEEEIQPEEEVDEETTRESEEAMEPSSVADEVLAWLKDRDKELEAKETEHEEREPELEKPKEETETEAEPQEKEPFPEDPEVQPYPEREPIPEDRIEPKSPQEERSGETVISEEESEETPLSSPGGYSFLEWFKHLDEPKQPEEAPPESGKEEVEQEDLIDQAITNEAAYQVEALEEKPSVKEPSREIPQPFKSDEPKEVDETDLQQVEQQAQKSVEWGDEVVSETLARVFAAQGKTQKAIEMYEKLRLKYPGKSDYFASAISKLQDN